MEAFYILQLYSPVQLYSSALSFSYILQLYSPAIFQIQLCPPDPFCSGFKPSVMRYLLTYTLDTTRHPKREPSTTPAVGPHEDRRGHAVQRRPGPAGQGGDLGLGGTRTLNLTLPYPNPNPNPDPNPNPNAIRIAQRTTRTNLDLHCIHQGDGKHNFMGQVETSVRAMLESNNTAVNVVEPLKKAKKASYVNSGTLMFSNVVIEHHPTLTEVRYTKTHPSPCRVAGHRRARDAVVLWSFT